MKNHFVTKIVFFMPRSVLTSSIEVCRYGRAPLYSPIWKSNNFFFQERICKMINAVVYSRASMVKLIRIPHPKFDRKSMFGSGFNYYSSDIVGIMASIVGNIVDTVKYVFTPYFFDTPCNQQWVIVRVHSAGLLFLE